MRQKSLVAKPFNRQIQLAGLINSGDSLPDIHNYALLYKLLYRLTYWLIYKSGDAFK